MRYYLIEILQKVDGEDERVILRQYASHKNGVYNPGALQIEMDISRYDFNSPTQESRVSIWGLSPGLMQQDQIDLPGLEMRVSAGMANGLPLSASGTAGLVIQATILQVIGNWQGTELRQDFILTAQPLGADVVNVARLPPVNLTLVWRDNVPLSDALTACFQAAGIDSQISIDERLVQGFDGSMFCGSLEELAQSINKISRRIIENVDYLGVRMVYRAGVVYVYDSAQSNNASYPRTTTDLKFTDLIGQPAWIKFGVVSVVLVMRHDILVGDLIRLPKESRPVSLQGSVSQYRNRLAFTGVFMVYKVRFIGNNRSPDANSWVVIVEAGIQKGGENES